MRSKLCDVCRENGERRCRVFHIWAFSQAKHKGIDIQKGPKTNKCTFISMNLRSTY